MIWKKFESLNFNNDLTHLRQWNLENSMILNSLKTKALVFTCSVKPTLFLCGKAIETVDSYKNLGMIIDEKFNWNKYADPSLCLIDDEHFNVLKVLFRSILTAMSSIICFVMFHRSCFSMVFHTRSCTTRKSSMTRQYFLYAKARQISSALL